MTHTTPTIDASHQRRALLVALLYAAFAALWIMLSDVLLAWWLPDGKLRTQVGLLKGWLFVGVTAILLYVLLYRSTAASPPEATRRDPPLQARVNEALQGVARYAACRPNTRPRPCWRAGPVR